MLPASDVVCNLSERLRKGYTLNWRYEAARFLPQRVISMPLERSDVSELIALYQRYRYVVIPRLIRIEEAQRYLHLGETSPRIRASLETGRSTWGQREIDDATNTELFAFFRRPELVDLVRRATGWAGSYEECTICSWMNVYGTGEFIPRHVDAAGTAQLVLCLEAPAASNGGQLVLESGGEMVDIALSPGDGLLFEATRLYHCTTPLRPTMAVGRPSRAVAIARYTFGNGEPGGVLART